MGQDSVYWVTFRGTVLLTGRLGGVNEAPSQAGRSTAASGHKQTFYPMLPQRLLPGV